MDISTVFKLAIKRQHCEKGRYESLFLFKLSDQILNRQRNTHRYNSICIAEHSSCTSLKNWANMSMACSPWVWRLWGPSLSVMSTRYLSPTVHPSHRLASSLASTSMLWMTIIDKYTRQKNKVLVLLHQVKCCSIDEFIRKLSYSCLST